jgi:DNA-binding NarL/FixJ family response regulator
LRVVIVDDNRHFLDAAATVLRTEGMDVVGTANTSAEALELTEGLRPDIVLVDVDLGDESGFDLAEELSRAKSVCVVLISAYPESDLFDLIAASSALGFLPKSDLSARAVRDLLGTESR